MYVSIEIFLSEYLFDGNSSTEAMFDLLISRGYYPDLIIILYASDEARRKRITARDNNDSDIKKCINGDMKYRKIIDFAENKQFNYILVDTDNLDLEKYIWK